MAESTLVEVQGKGSNPKTTLYVGGLDETVNEAVLHSAFIPFGEIKEVNIPIDPQTGKHRGFGFVEYLDKEDAAAAIDNMHSAELYGRVLKCNYALPIKIRGGEKGVATQAVWADADSWYERQLQEQEVKRMLKEDAERAEKAKAKDPMAQLEEEREEVDAGKS